LVNGVPTGISGPADWLNSKLTSLTGDWSPALAINTTFDPEGDTRRT
jgi:hypothetical protein